MLHKTFNIGDAVYYVATRGEFYSIHKSTIIEVNEVANGGMGSLTKRTYHCQDGYIIDSTHLAQPVFKTKDDAVSYIINELQNAISSEQTIICNAQSRIDNLNRSLTLYKKQVYPTEKILEIAEQIVNAISKRANSEYPSRKQTFYEEIKVLQKELEEHCASTGSPAMNLGEIDYKFCKAWSDRIDNALPDQQKGVMELYKEAFRKKYLNN